MMVTGEDAGENTSSSAVQESMTLSEHHLHHHRRKEETWKVWQRGRLPPGPVSRHVQILDYYSLKNDSSLCVSAAGFEGKCFFIQHFSSIMVRNELCNLTHVDAFESELSF